MRKKQLASYFAITVILLGCSYVNESSQYGINSNIEASNSSATVQNSVEISLIPHFDTFDDLILNLKSYYSFLNIQTKQYDIINEYIANAELLDSLERQAFANNQESLVENLKLALNDIANMKDSMLSESVTETERSIIMKISTSIQSLQSDQILVLL